MKHLTLLLLLIMTSVVVTQAQVVQTLKGTVVDQQSEMPIIGAAIELLTVDGIEGTITDFDGSYSLTVPDDVTVLVFSYTGFQSQEVAILEPFH